MNNSLVKTVAHIWKNRRESFETGDLLKFSQLIQDYYWNMDYGNIDSFKDLNILIQFESKQFSWFGDTIWVISKLNEKQFKIFLYEINS